MFLLQMCLTVEGMFGSNTRNSPILRNLSQANCYLISNILQGSSFTIQQFLLLLGTLKPFIGHLKFRNIKIVVSWFGTFFPSRFLQRCAEKNNENKKLKGLTGTV